MAKVTKTDLMQVPSQLLYDELVRRVYDENSDVFAVELWVRDDVEVVTDDVDGFMENSKYFMDRMMELGWGVLEDLA